MYYETSVVTASNDREKDVVPGVGTLLSVAQWHPLIPQQIGQLPDRDDSIQRLPLPSPTKWDWCGQWPWLDFTKQKTTKSYIEMQLYRITTNSKP